ncbi:MAG: hypothetical protein MK213_00625 [Planctomycetes bacterium]|nr:hypothetical protein [Planctomycetota bacterium]
MLLVVVAGGLLFWGPSWFTPADPVEARTPPVTVEAPVVVEQPKPEPLPPTPSVPVEVAPPAFAVKVITYTYNSRNQKLAVATATALRKRGLPGVQALVRPPLNPKHIEIYVGSASSKLELASQRGRIRALEYPEGSGEKPFASATIDSLPVTQNP